VTQPNRPPGIPARFNRAAPLDPYKRFKHGLCVVESKRWARPLDRESKGSRQDAGVPSTQMLRYLRRIDDLAPGGLQWGILTNGSVWRLYWQRAVSVAEDFFEIDLAKTLGHADLDLIDRQTTDSSDPAAARAHALRLFILFFGRDGFLANHAGRSFHDLALEQGKFWEQRVARDLSDVVFDEVFPALANAIAQADPQRDRALGPAYLDAVRQGTLVVLYAEDRNLLPDESGAYADYALTRLRVEIAERLSTGRSYSATWTNIWARLAGIFRAISKGDDSLGIPPYNGGLFAGETAPILERVALPDTVMADVIVRLSHQADARSGRGPKYINYRDLSVQQLGSVYERILEHGIRARADGTVDVVVDPSARKGFGSYYTPEELVTLVIQRTVGPLVADRRAAFADLARDSGGTPSEKALRLDRLRALDPASRMLELKICDPAMGSGHFLVTLVDWLADEVLSAMAEASMLVDWAEYDSPLAARIEAVRAEIAGNAKAHGWPLRDDQLDDRHIVRRMILKRVVHGVDKNRMAVELAKVSLWLHSFTVGAPLTFLDHHLRWGDSVVGAWTRPVVEEMQARGALMRPGLLRQVERAAEGMHRVEESNDSDLSEVARSEQAFAAVEEDTAAVAHFFSLLTAERMMGIVESAPKKQPPPIEALVKAGRSEKQIARAREDSRAFERAAAFQLILDGTFGDPVAIAAGTERILPDDLRAQYSLIDPDPPAQATLFEAPRTDDRRRLLADDLVAEARALAARHRFLHWQIAFPNVWRDLASSTPAGGFDAVIGNPPYVRQELLGEIKPALKPRPDDPGLTPPHEDDTAEQWARWRRGLLDARPGFLAFDGMADLYVYFYEQGLRLLRPGGRMGYVVTNKWLKAGYAAALRGLFGEAAWAEFLADFGHAKHFFPDADVFPSVLVVRRPDGPDGPADLQVCAIPRDAVPHKGVAGVVADSSYPLPRAGFTRQSWTLEPPAVKALLDKIRRNGVPLAEYAGVKPLYGIKTGFNEAFLIDTPTKERLVAEDPKCAGIIKPYLRGQDVERWHSPESGLYMIVMKSSSDHPWPWASASDEQSAEAEFRSAYPPLHMHFKAYEERLRARQDKGRLWWELRSCAYYSIFEEAKIFYQEIQYHPCYSLLAEHIYANNKVFMIGSADKWLLSLLNSPLMWWFNWRNLPHMKDEALSPTAIRMEDTPIASNNELGSIGKFVTDISAYRQVIFEATSSALAWLHHEFGISKPAVSLGSPQTLTTDSFIEAVKASLPRRRRLSAADIGELKREYATTIEPARQAAADVLRLERRLSDLVNQAYGLTPEEVRLMWETAPPRMPLNPAEELERLKRGER